MLKMGELRELSEMRISFDVPSEWMPKLRLAAATAGSRSVAAFLRAYVERTVSGVGITQVEQIEGNERDDALAQIEEDPQITQVRADALEAERVRLIEDVMNPEKPAQKLQKAAESIAPAKKPGMATTKDPNFQPPPGYGRKPVRQLPKTPPVIGNRTAKNEPSDF